MTDMTKRLQEDYRILNDCWAIFRDLFKTADKESKNNKDFIKLSLNKYLKVNIMDESYEDFRAWIANGFICELSRIYNEVNGCGNGEDK